MIPFSMRELPKTKAQFNIANDFSMLGFTLPLRESFDAAIASVNKQMRAMKKSAYPFAIHALSQVVTYLPQFMQYPITQWAISKATLALSNVPGPKTPLIMNGARSKGWFGVAAGAGTMSFSMAALSMHNTVYMTVSAEKNIVPDTKVIRALLEENYDRLVANLKSD